MSSWFALPGQVLQILDIVKQIQAQGVKEMSALTDLQSAVSAAAATMQSAVSLIQQMQAGEVSDADVEAQVTALNQAASALQAVVSPSPTPTP